MTPKLQPGERVTIRGGRTVYRVAEVDPVGVGLPPIPSTYLVRLRPVSGVGSEAVYGDRALVRER